MNFLLIVSTLFLPLFPLSMLFTSLFEKLSNTWARIGLLVVWPQIGLLCICNSDLAAPDCAVYLGLGTSLLYGFRALVLRDLSHWVSFIAVSSWALLWGASCVSDDYATLALAALGSSIPMGLLLVLGDRLIKQFGAAYTGLYNGLGHAMPRLSGLLVFSILAVIATPVFPGFVLIMAAFLHTVEISFAATISLCLIWMSWAWAGARLIQGFVIGEGPSEKVEDIPSSVSWGYTALLSSLVIFGILMIGQLS